MDAVLNFVIENIASNSISDFYDIAKSWATDDLSEKFKDRLNSLNEQLPQVKAVVHMVNNRGLGLLETNEDLIRWSWQFKDAVEAAEDVIDEMEYNKIEKKLSSEDVAVSSNENKILSVCKKKVGECSSRIFSGFKRKFDDYTGANSRSVNNDTNDMLKKETADRLEKVVEELDKVIERMQRFLLMGLPSRDAKCQNHEEFLNSRETAGLDSAQVVGRENDRQQIIAWLNKIENETPRSNMQNIIHVFTIVGEGGMGKTTLARLVKTDPFVIERFNLILWVCVSTKFDVTKIMKDILQDINTDQNLPQSLHGLQKALQAQLKGKRFLLVLDDVWDMDNTIQLDKLMAPLKFAEKGSIILVTTRMNSVAATIANVIETNKEVLMLKGIEYEDYLQLFFRHAFGGSDSGCHNELKSIGAKIAMKLGGCPLAAKNLGEHLYRNQNKDYWLSILKKQTKIDAVTEKDVFKANLRLSYEKLDSGLQKCFRFCSIFPKDFKFNKDELIYMWIGSGSIMEKNKFLEHSLEITGGKYINDLERESFFKKSNGSNSCYIMNDLLHDVARSVSVEESLCIEDGLANTNFPKTIRHLYISSEAKDNNLFHGIAQLEKLRTLIISFKGDDPQGNHVALLRMILTKLPSLRVLSLTASFSCKLPDVIGSLIRLRYLSIHQTTNTSQQDWFPDTTYKLYNLRILRLVGGSGGNYAGVNVKGLTSLTNLQYLEIPSTIKDRIPYIGKLAHLQGSINFQVKNAEGFKITELMNLMSIGELCIFGLQEVGSFQEAREVNLEKKNSLRSLKLIWPNDSTRNSGKDKLVADELCPPEMLGELTVKGYNGTHSPRWFATFSEKPFLTSMSLIECRNWSLLDLTWLPSLEFLQIKDVGLVSFPVIFEANGSSQDASSSSSTISSSLKILEIKYCMKLENIQPNGLKNVNSLKKVLIGECPNLDVTDANAEFLPTSLEKLSIGSCRNLELHLGASLVHLTSLKNLSLENCATMTTLPSTHVFQELRALTRLEIKKCTELKSLGGLEAVPSLNSLTIFGCNKLVAVSLTQNHNAAGNTNPTLNLKSLKIDKESLLSIEPLRNLIAVQEIQIGDASGVSTFQALLESMRNLPSLSKLYICNATQVNDLPNFPTSLQSLHICGCSAAPSQQFQNGTVPSQQFQNGTVPSHRSVELLGVRCTTQSFMSDLEFDRKDLI